MSLNSNTLFISSFSSSFIEPFSSPTSTIILISSSVTVSSSVPDIPNNFDTPFVDAVSNFTNGAVIIDIVLIIPIVPKAIFSLFLIASLFGTNSPKISEKYESIIVIKIIDMFLHAVNPKGIKFCSIGAKSSANASAANALDKNPASVIPICIVAKNLLGSLSIFFICFAFLFPSFACFSIFASLIDINAISVAAKNAFINISIANTIIRDI